MTVLIDANKHKLPLQHLFLDASSLNHTLQHSRNLEFGAEDTTQLGQVRFWCYLFSKSLIKVFGATKLIALKGVARDEQSTPVFAIKLLTIILQH